MYLFSRTLRLAPSHLLDGMEWAIAVTEKVNQVTALNVGVWTPILSEGIGSLSWTCFAGTLTDLENAETKLLADPIYLDLVRQGADLTVGGTDDLVAQILSPLPADYVEPTHASIVQSVLANGQFQKGVAVGLEIAEQATKIAGLTTSFLLATTGAYGGCAWVTGATSLQALEEGQTKANSDEGFQKLIDRDAKVYVEGVTTTRITRRIA